MNARDRALAEGKDYARGTYAELGARLIARRSFAAGWVARAAEEPSDEQVARIIDQHRQKERWTGSRGVIVVCTCGHDSIGHHDGPEPLDDEHNSHRDADRAHATHVAAQLHAARDTGGQS